MKTLVEELKLRAVRVKESSANKQIFADAAKTIERHRAAIIEYLKADDEMSSACQNDAPSYQLIHDWECAKLKMKQSLDELI